MKHKIGAVLGSLLIALVFAAAMPSYCLAEANSTRSIPTETVTKSISISSCGSSWVKDGKTAITARGYATVRLTSGSPVYAAALNDNGLLAAQQYVGSTGTTVTFFSNTYGGTVSFYPSLMSGNGTTVYPAGTWTFVSR